MSGSAELQTDERAGDAPIRPKPSTPQSEMTLGAQICPVR